MSTYLDHILDCVELVATSVETSVSPEHRVLILVMILLIALGYWVYQLFHR